MQRIAIHSVPRSGSTWVGSIFDSHPNVLYRYQPLFSYALKDFLNEKSSKEEIDLFFKKLFQIKDDFIEQTEFKKKGIVPYFKKDIPTTIVYKEVRYNNLLENLLKKDEKLKVIGIVRNPLSVLASWYKAPREFRKDLGWTFENEWKFALSKNQSKPEEFFGFEKWKEVTELFEKLKFKYPDRFYLLEYKKLLTETEATIESMFNFCNLRILEQTTDFLIKSRKKNINNIYSVFKTKTNDDAWKNILPQKIINSVYEELQNTGLSKYLKGIVLNG